MNATITFAKTCLVNVDSRKQFLKKKFLKHVSLLHRIRKLLTRSRYVGYTEIEKLRYVLAVFFFKTFIRHFYNKVINFGVKQQIFTIIKINTTII